MTKAVVFDLNYKDANSENVLHTIDAGRFAICYAQQPWDTNSPNYEYRAINICYAVTELDLTTVVKKAIKIPISLYPYPIYCGYVKIPDHSVNEINTERIDVYGGITYREDLLDQRAVMLGFDSAHSPAPFARGTSKGGIIAYMKGECQSMANQIMAQLFAKQELEQIMKDNAAKSIITVLPIAIGRRRFRGI